MVLNSLSSRSSCVSTFEYINASSVINMQLCDYATRHCYLIPLNISVKPDRDTGRTVTSLVPQGTKPTVIRLPAFNIFNNAESTNMPASQALKLRLFVFNS